jgi:hypothetical protein
MKLLIYKYRITHKDGEQILFDAPLIDTIGGELVLTNLGLTYAISQVDHDRLLVVGFTTTDEQKK